MQREDCSERGQAVLGAVVWIVLVMVLALGLARVATAARDEARAATAADAAALAGAAAGDAAAEEAANRNGATLISITHFGEQVQVRVRIGRALADARAERVRRTT